MAVYPFIPNKEEEEELEEEDEDDNEQIPMENKLGQKSKDENKPDPEVAQFDVIKVFLANKAIFQLSVRYTLQGHLSQAVSVKRGIKQGCILTP